MSLYNVIIYYIIGHTKPNAEFAGTVEMHGGLSSLSSGGLVEGQ
jgi:hypothetical protein